MKRVTLFLLFSTLLLAIENPLLRGHWEATTISNHQGTQTIEKEYLWLKPNHTFSILLFVSVQKEDAFVKGLEIKASGVWRSHKEILVYRVQNIDVPFAKEVYRISMASLRALSEHFKSRFENETMRIIKIKELSQKRLILINEKGYQTDYYPTK